MKLKSLWGEKYPKFSIPRQGDSEVVKILTSSTKIAKHYVIPPEGSITYYRLIFEISDTSVPNTVRFDVNKGSVGQIQSCNLSDPKRTNVVVELKIKTLIIHCSLLTEKQLF